MEYGNNNQNIIKKPGLSEAAGALFIIFGLLVFFSVYSRGMGGEGSTQNLVGTFGHYMSVALMFLFGDASYFLGPFLVFMGGLGIYQGNMEDPVLRILSLLVILVSLSVLFHVFSDSPAHEILSAGGIVGRNLGNFAQYMFGGFGSVLVAGGIFLTSLFLSLRMPLPVLADRIQELFFRILIWSGAAWIIKNLKYKSSSDVSYTPRGRGALAEFLETIASAGEKKIAAQMQRTGPDTNSQKIYNQPPAGTAPQTETAVTDAPSAQEKTELKAAVLPDVHLPDPKEEVKGKTAVLQADQVKSSKHWLRPAVNADSGTGMAGSLKRLAGELRAVYEKTGTLGEKSPVFRMEYQTVLLSRSSQAKRPFFEGKFSPDERRFHFRRRQPGTEAAAVPQEDRLMPEIRVNLWEAFHPQPVPVKEDGGAKTAESVKEIYKENISVAEENPFAEDEDLTVIREADPEITEGPADHQSASESFQRNEVQYDEAALPAPEAEHSVPSVNLNGKKYRLTTDRLNLPVKQNAFDIKEETDSTRARLEQVMKEFGVAAKVVDMQRGPILTRYEVKLEPGMRVNRILSIEDEIKMNLEAPSVRIVAPIPGKATVGIEIPNRHRDSVYLGEMVRLDPEFFSKSRDLSIVLGKDISGSNCYADLAKLPHLLIAGATGAGKSVYMNAVIASLLYTQSPEDVRFIMIDPKMVELKLYEGIPHLLMPVITDVKKASRALNWAVQEMEYRYAILSKAKCRDIRSYNEKYAQSDLFENKKNKMPYIILLIDELADLMMVAAKDVEDSIIRLTQKARAVGIHVIMATQRPSVDVITALIKANCPARISFHVAQRTDSRTILDANGAETLLGKGDMLFKSPVSTELKRIQAPLITEKEIEAVVSETRKFGEPVYIELDEDYENEDDVSDEIDDHLFNEAWNIIRETGKTSTSYIQRRLRIGYNRAANLMELFEKRGYLSEASGNKPREILRKD